MALEEETRLLKVSVQLGGSHVSLVAWRELTVRGLAQRMLSGCGLNINPDAVELHLDRYVLAPSSSLGQVMARWHHPDVQPTGGLRLKALVPSHVPGKARPKLDARAPPRHTVRAVISRALAVMAMPPGTTRLESAVITAAEVCLLPYTFTNWTDAWEHSLMKTAALLFRDLLTDKPGAAGCLLRACSDLLDLPAALAPRGPLFRGLCILQLHIHLLQLANELKAGGWWPVVAAAQAPVSTIPAATVVGDATAAQPCAQTSSPSSCRAARGAAAACGSGGRGGRRRVGAASDGRWGGGGNGDGSSSSGSSSGSSSSSGSISRSDSSSGRGRGCFSKARAAEARQLCAALDGLARLLDKASVRVAVVLEQLSCYGSELSDMLGSYSPLSAVAEASSPVAEVAAGFTTSSTGQEDGSGGGDSGGRAAASAAALPPAARDLRLQAAEVLEPYAAMQLLDAFGRLVAAGAQPPACGGGPAPLLPPGTLPSGWGCHRSLFHTILDLALHAGVQRGGTSAAGERGHGHGGDEGVDRNAAAHDGPGLGPTHGLVVRAPASGPTLELPLLASMLDSLLQLHMQAHAGCKSGGGGATGSDSTAGAAGVGGSGGADDSDDDDSSSDAAAARCCPRSPAVHQLPPCLDWLQDVISVLGAACDVYELAGGWEAAEEEADEAMAAAEELPTTVVAAVGATAAEPTRLDDAVEELEAAPTADASAGWTGPTAPVTPVSGGGAGGGTAGGTDRDSGDVAGVGPVPFTCGSGVSELALSRAPSAPVTAVTADREKEGKEDGALAPATPPLTAAASATVPFVVAAATGVGGYAAAGTALKGVPAAAAASDAAAVPAIAVAAVAAVAGAPSLAPYSSRRVILDALLRAFQCPCLVGQALAGGARTWELCERSVWRHPRLAGCAPAAAYQKQLLDDLLTPLSYVYDEDDYDAPVVVVDRSDLLGSSMASLMDQENLCHEGICVSFEGEMAHGDGVLREWLTEIAAAVFDPNAGLFRLCEGDVRALHPSPAGCQQDNQLELLNFAGKIIGLAMRARVPLGFHLSSALFKLLQHPGGGSGGSGGGSGRAALTLADLAQLDPRLAVTCGQIAAASDVEALGLTFVASCGQLGLAHEVPLLPGGAGEDVPVTAANRRDFLDRLVRFYCTWGCSSEHELAAMANAGGAGRGTGSATDAGGGYNWDECVLDVVEALAQGLADALFQPDYDSDGGVEALAARLRPAALAAFNARLGGEVGGIDVGSWRAHTSAPAFKSDLERAALEAFWEVVSELSADDQRRMLQFWTGISHLPAGGFKHLSQQLQIVPARPEDGGVASDGAAGGADGGGNVAAAVSAAIPAVEVSAVAEEEAEAAIEMGEDDWEVLFLFLHGNGDGDGGGGGGVRQHNGSGASGSSDPASADGAATDGGAGSPASSSSGGGTSSAGGAGGVGSASSPADGGVAAAAAGTAAVATGEVVATNEERQPAALAAGGGRRGGVTSRPVLLAAHTCFFQLRLPLLGSKADMREAVAESLANLGAFWNE